MNATRRGDADAAAAIAAPAGLAAARGRPSPPPPARGTAAPPRSWGAQPPATAIPPGGARAANPRATTPPPRRAGEVGGESRRVGAWIRHTRYLAQQMEQLSPLRLTEYSHGAG